MELRKIVYDGIWAEYGAGQQFLWEDVVRPGFDFWGNIESPTVEQQQKMLLRAAEISERELVARYVAGMDPTFKRGDALTIGERAYTSYAGVLNDSLVDMILVSTHDYHHGTLSRRLAAPAAAKAHMLGLDKVELVQFDRDKQDWFWFTVTGNFKAARTFIETEVMGTHRIEPELIITPNVSMTVKLDSYLWGLNKLENERTKCVIHPSEISTSDCDRRIAYGLYGEEEKEKIDPKLRRIFDVGHVYHDLVQSSLHWGFPNFHAEVPAKNKDLRIHGNCDGVINGERRLGLEIKSIGSSGFRKLTKAKTEHVEQATIYGANLNLEAVVYFYVCKEDANIQIYEIPLDRKLWHQVAARAEGIVSTVARKELPPPLVGKDSVCKACKYAWTCKPEFSPTNKTRMFSR